MAKIKVAGVWRDSSAFYIKVAGTWRRCTSGWIKVGGVWKEFGLGVPYLYWADSVNHVVRRINLDTSVVSTISGTFGTGVATGDGGLATAATLIQPSDIIFDKYGDLYIAETGNHRVRKVSSSTGIISTVIGNGTGSNTGDGGLATSATIWLPTGLAFDEFGDLYITSNPGAQIRKITTSTGIVTRYAGDGIQGQVDGPLSTCALWNPNLMQYVKGSGLYLTQFANVAARLINTSALTISLIAGTGVNGSGPSGVASTSTLFYSSRGLYKEPTGTGTTNLLIGDSGIGATIWRFDNSGLGARFAGTGTAGAGADSVPATSSAINGVRGIAKDTVTGNVYFSDYGNNRIRKVNASGIVTTLVTGTANAYGLRLVYI